ncbi:hypothetical protein HRI_001707400 [Hibiscus trionum]|uniref:Endonuclease/exonuclease/phosphatase domain-containing protein n=1 Tax=Hibiscus trionum TaxID=183268 RepID=A0A9W7HNM3_HIBTR|nr:hypothetical protein HRI_001707400 [Hibiscus trionum]
MKLLSWNVRGLGKPRARKRLQASLRDVNPSVIFLIETKLQASEMLNVRRRWGFQCGVEVSSRGRSGGLCLSWKMDSDVTLRSFSDRHIDAMISKALMIIVGALQAFMRRRRSSSELSLGIYFVI